MDNVVQGKIFAFVNRTTQDSIIVRQRTDEDGKVVQDFVSGTLPQFSTCVVAITWRYGVSASGLDNNN